jgi:hypothetical protein
MGREKRHLQIGKGKVEISPQRLADLYRIRIGEPQSFCRIGIKTQAGTKSLIMLGGIFYQDSYFGHRFIPYPDKVVSGAAAHESLNQGVCNHRA